RLLVNKYYVDEIYGAVIIRPVVYLSVFLWKIVDVIVIDGFLNGLAVVWREIAETFKLVQTGRVRSYATVFLIGVLAVVAYFAGWFGYAH
ncbi:MAG: NADH-quinone oxidoreductase subunit L, partial [candidate division Zixibacteria bacterium]|nr:NADH-quinone oxidoreductase subunit L [candidate division Zixibacteria bacterium]